MSYDTPPSTQEQFPKQTLGDNYGEPPAVTQKHHFLSRLAGTNHELALLNAESHEEITFLLNHANEVRPQFSGTLRRRLLRAAAQRRQQLRNAVLFQNENKTGEPCSQEEEHKNVT